MLDEIMNQALLIDKTNLTNPKEILYVFKEEINKNQQILLQANKIDNKNNNGYLIDFDVTNKILTRIEKEQIFYRQVILSQKDEDKKIIYGKEIFDQGNVIVINDGNTYAIIEMIARNILAANTTIFVNDGYMYGVNNLIIELIQAILEKNNISKNLIQMCITTNYEKVLSNYANIDLIVCIGNQNLQREVLNKSKNKIILSGYENFELYIEDTANLDFINKIIKTQLNIDIYINKSINLDIENAIYVDNIDEAISKINYTSARYSSAIFTNSKENAIKFIQNIKSSTTTINTSPTIERILDIKQEDLIKEKTIIYPIK